MKSGGDGEARAHQPSRKRVRQSAPKQHHQQQQIGIESDLQASLQRLVAEGQLGSEAAREAVNGGAGAAVNTAEQTVENEDWLQVIKAHELQMQQDNWINVTNVGLDATADSLTDIFSSVGNVLNVKFLSRFAAEVQPRSPPPTHTLPFIFSTGTCEYTCIVQACTSSHVCFSDWTRSVLHSYSGNQVEFEESQMADAAIRSFDLSEVDGKTIRVRSGFRMQDQQDNKPPKKVSRTAKDKANTPAGMPTHSTLGGRSGHLEYNLAVRKELTDALPVIYAKVQNRIEHLNSGVAGDASSASTSTSRTFETFESRFKTLMFEEFPVRDQDDPDLKCALDRREQNARPENGLDRLPEVLAADQTAEKKKSVAVAAVAAASSTAALLLIGDQNDNASPDSTVFDDDSVVHQVKNCESTLELVELFGILGVQHGKLRKSHSSLNVDHLTVYVVSIKILCLLCTCFLCVVFFLFAFAFSLLPKSTLSFSLFSLSLLRSFPVSISISLLVSLSLSLYVCLNVLFPQHLSLPPPLPPSVSSCLSRDICRDNIVVIMKHLSFLITNRRHKKAHAGKVTVMKSRIQSQLLKLLEQSPEPADLSYNASVIARSCFDTRSGYTTRMPFHLKLELCEAVVEHGLNTVDQMNPKSLSWFVFALGRMYADLYSGWPRGVHGRVHQELPEPFRDVLYTAILSKSREAAWDPHSCSRLIVNLSNLCPTCPPPEVVQALVESMQQAIGSESFGAQATTRIAQTFGSWAEQGWLFHKTRSTGDGAVNFDDVLVQCVGALTWKADAVMEDFMPGQIAKLIPALAKIRVGAHSNSLDDTYVSVSVLLRLEHRIATIGASLSGSNIVDILVGFDAFNVRPSVRVLDLLESTLLSNEAFAGVCHLEMPVTTVQALRRSRGPGTMENVLGLMKLAIGVKPSAEQGGPIADDQAYDLFEEDGVAAEVVGLPLTWSKQASNGRPLQLVEMTKYLHACASLGIMLPNRNPRLYTAIDTALGDMHKIVKGAEGVRIMPTWYFKNTALDASAAAHLLWALTVFDTLGTSVCAPHILTLLLDSMAANSKSTAAADYFERYPRARKDAVLKDAYQVRLRLHEVFTAIGQLKVEGSGGRKSSSKPNNVALLKGIVSQHKDIVKNCRDTFVEEQTLAPADKIVGVSPRDGGKRVAPESSIAAEDEAPSEMQPFAPSQRCQHGSPQCPKRAEFQAMISEIDPSALLDAVAPDMFGGYRVAAWVPSKGIAFEFYGPYSYTLSTDSKQRPRLNGATLLKERTLVSNGAHLSGVGFYEWSAGPLDGGANNAGSSASGMHEPDRHYQQESLAPEPFPEVVEKIGKNFAPERILWRDWLSVKLKKMTLY